MVSATTPGDEDFRVVAAWPKQLPINLARIKVTDRHHELPVKDVSKSLAQARATSLGHARLISVCV